MAGRQLGHLGHIPGVRPGLQDGRDALPAGDGVDQGELQEGEEDEARADLGHPGHHGAAHREPDVNELDVADPGQAVHTGAGKE